MGIGRFRNSAKAIIIEDGKVLAVCRDDPAFGEWYLLPGGGQRPGEDLHAALRRELLEEAGIEIEIDGLVLVREYIGANHEFVDADGDLHQVELMFVCRRAGADGRAQTPKVGHAPDADQVRVEWLPLERLPEIPFYPKALGRMLRDGPEALDAGHVVYMGDVN